MAVAATTNTRANVGDLAPKLGVAAATVLSFGVALVWVGNRVSAQLSQDNLATRQVRLKLAADQHREQQLKRRLQQVIQSDRSLAAQRSAVASALALANQQVVSTERAINQTIVQIDQLTQAPETNLLPITPGSSVGHLGSVNLPALPAAPPVHTTTGASGVP